MTFNELARKRYSCRKLSAQPVEQEKLNAIIEANVPVEMNVTYGVHRQAGELITIDMGRKRTYANVVQMSGILDPVYKYCGIYVSSYIRYKLPGGRKADPAEIADYIERHYEDVKKLYVFTGGSTSGHGRGGSHKIPAVVGAAMMAAIYRGESEEALYQFSQVYRLNDVSGCRGYNPKYDEGVYFPFRYPASLLLISRKPFATLFALVLAPNSDVCV